MSLRNSLFLTVVLFAWSAGICPAQEHRVVTLETNLPEAAVFADSMRLGAAARGTFLVPADAKTLRLVPERGESWSIRPVTASLQTLRGDTLMLRMYFPYHYKVESVPFGADVLLETVDGRERLGETPVLYRSPQPLEGTLLLERDGYASERVEPGREVWNRHVVTLEPLAMEPAQTAEIDWEPPRKPRRWIDYTAAAVAVAAGVMSIHYKFKADNRYDEYRRTGDPDLRSSIEALDTRAAVALGVAQVGIGVVAIRLALR